MIPLKDNIPTARPPLVTLALIAANVIVYLLSLRHGGLLGGPDSGYVVKFGAIPYELTHPGSHCALAATGPDFVQTTVACEGRDQIAGTIGAQPATGLTLLSSMFSHAGLLHLAGNMLFLWIFGNNVEDAMGRLRFLAFYLLGGLVALALQVAMAPDSAVPTLGASGAIAAVLGGYILLYPRARVLTLVFIILFFGIIELPAVAVLGIWFAEQALFAFAGSVNPVGDTGGVAYFAHVGGFIFGLALIGVFATRRKPAWR